MTESKVSVQFGTLPERATTVESREWELRFVGMRGKISVDSPFCTVNLNFYLKFKKLENGKNPNRKTRKSKSKNKIR